MEAWGWIKKSLMEKPISIHWLWGDPLAGGVLHQTKTQHTSMISFFIYFFYVPCQTHTHTHHAYVWKMTLACSSGSPRRTKLSDVDCCRCCNTLNPGQHSGKGVSFLSERFPVPASRIFLSFNKATHSLSHVYPPALSDSPAQEFYCPLSHCVMLIVMSRSWSDEVTPERPGAESASCSTLLTPLIVSRLLTNSTRGKQILGDWLTDWLKHRYF